MEGSISGCEAAWSAVLGYESNRTAYRFSGLVADAAMGGEVTLGECGAACREARTLGSAARAPR
jgi:hypothetical protein